MKKAQTNAGSEPRQEVITTEGDASQSPSQSTGHKPATSEEQERSTPPANAGKRRPRNPRGGGRNGGGRRSAEGSREPQGPPAAQEAQEGDEPRSGGRRGGGRSGERRAGGGRSAGERRGAEGRGGEGRNGNGGERRGNERRGERGERTERTGKPAGRKGARGRGPRPGRGPERQREAVAVATGPSVTITGILEHSKDGTANLRRVLDESGAVTGDAFMPANLRPADYRMGVEVQVEAGPGNARTPWVVRKILAVDGEPPENARLVPPLERGIVIDPHEYLKLETDAEPIGTRIIDLFCPIGKGTRGMIVAPPRSGKTVLLKQIANALSVNYPDIKLIILLIDERPEEVTDFRRSVPNAEIWASSNDESLQSHMDNARLAVARAKRIVERGGDVVILMDSITRLARAFNAAGEGSRGRTMTGGVAAGAMQEPRAIFGASRCLEDGGSLTMLATALIETGSAMDELIFQEFKGTGNMELVLDRKLAEKRYWPAIDVAASGTRKDEKLLDPVTHKRVSLIRRYLSGMDMISGTAKVLEKMEKTSSNEELLKLFEP